MSIIIYVLVAVAVLLLLSLKKKPSEENEFEISVPQFENKWSNKLIELSHVAPFKWFIDDEEKSKSTKDIKKKIAEANLGHVIDYRGFQSLRIGVVLITLTLFIIVLAMMSNSQLLLRILFNIDTAAADAGLTAGSSMGSSKKTAMVIYMILLALNLVPMSLLKNRARQYQALFLQDIPVVQIFIILMLRSKKPVSDILFALSRVNTRYKRIFETSYLIFLRNKSEGFDYLEEKFIETKFKETIQVLRDLGEYSREDSIKLLENNMQQLVEANNSRKRKNDLANLVYSQGTIAIPFVALIVLGLLPIGVYGISILDTAGVNLF